LKRERIQDLLLREELNWKERVGKGGEERNLLEAIKKKKESGNLP